MALGAETTPAERLAAETHWTAVVFLETENSRKHLWDLRLFVVVPTQHQKQEEAEGVAPVAQLKPERNVGCCVMTKAHMLITSIS